MKRIAPILFFISALHAAAFEQVDIQSINAWAAQKSLGTGKGVKIGVLDQGIDSTHPALRGSIYAERDFTGQKITDDDNAPYGHATGIASILVGHDKSVYRGIAPDAQLLNARVVNTKDVSTNRSAGDGLIWAAKSGAKVINMSFGNKFDEGPLTYKFNLMVDYVAEKYGATIVAAAGNENDSAVRQIPSGAFNLITVGALQTRAYSRVADFSNYALDNDDRTKPDLVAPGRNVIVGTANWEKDWDYLSLSGTSYASPMVGGVMAQLAGYGKSREMSTSPLLLKAIAMTSATKVRKFDGAPWAPRSGGHDVDYGYLFDQPLDEEQGAGRIDALGAYKLYAKKKDSQTPVNTWREGKLKANQSYIVDLGTLKKGHRVEATLTWLRHVAREDVDDDGLDADDRFYQTASLADFTLTLLKNGKPVAGSDSDVDNLEHLAVTLSKGGKYSLEVYRFVDSGIDVENFAIAARVLALGGEKAVEQAATPRPTTVLPVGGVTRGIEVPEPRLVGVGVLLTLFLRRKRAAARV